ncbi:hypothetical protein [Acinetobacter johnsonii]|uniref:hypothetical protein n=1 Tax=Acinetobacter johnsonii TaxID=40214 RepID=UPI00244BBDB7|nr:hypothetical protein [Acinetobacter johnsonii]MDH1407655.1 hypothetical protein [Acinetobacter johnsonii]
MNEFQNRVNLQRQIIVLVNKKLKFKEPLASLSYGCINRWKNVNKEVLDQTYMILLDLSNKVLFLATKSQEQITEEYAFKSEEAVLKLKYLESHLLESY